MDNSENINEVLTLREVARFLKCRNNVCFRQACGIRVQLMRQGASAACLVYFERRKSMSSPTP